ncbi:MAG: hypothetical protein IPL79_08760 [Myxococcales bacterium]|nr:hypothetical protein [Myxococcales bacterium]
MAKPIWELEPDGIDAELKRAQQAHRERTQAGPAMPSARVAPPVPAEPSSFASGTNRARTPGRVSPLPAPPIADLELEADFSELGGDQDFASAEFEGVAPTAETPAHLLQQLKQQTTAAAAKVKQQTNAEPAKSATRARQPAITPALPVSANPARPDPHSKSTAPMIAKAGRPASPPIVAKSSHPASAPAPLPASQTAPKPDPDPRLTPKPAAPVSTSYSVVRKNSVLFPPKKDE